MAVAAPIERWALILPTFPWIRFIGRYGRGTFVQVTARRWGLPIRWSAEHIVFAEEPRIVHRHLRGFTNGLWSECRIVVDGELVHLTLTHDWQPNWPLFGPHVARLVYRWLVLPIGEQTLRGVATYVESGRAAALQRLEAARRQHAGYRRRYGP